MVISPTVSLIRDQLASVNSGTSTHGLTAAALGSAGDELERESALRGGFHVVFTTPENALIAVASLGRELKLLVVGECHLAVE